MTVNEKDQEHADPGDFSSSFWYDFNPLILGELPPIRPTMACLTMPDGTQVCLIYPGSGSLVWGEQGSAKSFFGLHFSLEQVRLGNHVIYLDNESSGAKIGSRLLQMGATRDEVLTYFHYHRVDTQLGPEFFDAMAGTSPGAVVHDGLTNGYDYQGWDIISNRDTAAWTRLAVDPFRTVGSSVLMLDHPGPYGPIGAKHKLRGLDGTAFEFVARVQPEKNKIGMIDVVLRKDRDGDLWQYAPLPHRRIAQFKVDSTSPNWVFTTLEPPPDGSEAIKASSGNLREQLTELLKMLHPKRFTVIEILAMVRPAKGGEYADSSVRASLSGLKSKPPGGGRLVSAPRDPSSKELEWWFEPNES